MLLKRDGQLEVLTVIQLFDVKYSMIHFYAILLIACMLGQAACLQIQPKAMDLNKYKWENRVLLLFTPEANNGEYVKQKKYIAANAAGMPERDMVLIEVVGEGKVWIDGKEQEGVQGKQLREQFAIAPDAFTILLIGKDGTEKYRSKTAVPLEKIYALIDQMPMRQQEMRKQ